MAGRINFTPPLSQAGPFAAPRPARAPQQSSRAHDAAEPDGSSDPLYPDKAHPAAAPEGAAQKSTTALRGSIQKSHAAPPAQSDALSAPPAEMLHHETVRSLPSVSATIPEIPAATPHPPDIPPRRAIS